jgi:hypothetical protein
LRGSIFFISSTIWLKITCFDMTYLKSFSLSVLSWCFAFDVITYFVVVSLFYCLVFAGDLDGDLFNYDFCFWLFLWEDFSFILIMRFSFAKWDKLGTLTFLSRWYLAWHSQMLNLIYSNSVKMDCDLSISY